MWLSKRTALHSADPTAAVGTVTISGYPLSLLRDSEIRNVFLVSPGGFSWKPKVGDNVLALKCADGEDVIAGLITEDNISNLNDGEIRIFSDGTEIRLQNNGNVEVSGNLSISGNLVVNGSLSVAKNADFLGNTNISGSLVVNGQQYKPCNCDPS